GGIELVQDVLEAARLQAPGAGLRVAVHGIADPEHRLTGLPYGLDGLRQRRGDVLRAEAVNEGQPSRLVLRIERGDQALQPGRIHRGADLDTDGVGNAAEVLDVRAVELRGAHADPGHVRR